MQNSTISKPYRKIIRDFITRWFSKDDRIGIILLLTLQIAPDV